MRRSIKKACALVLACAMTFQPVNGYFGSKQVNAVGVADKFEIPAASASGRVGAEMPYTRYDSTVATLGGGATLKTSVDWAKSNIATQASEQSYVALPSNGSYAEWTMNTTGSGVTMRFTMPDSSDGMGIKGSVDVYVNGTYAQTVNLNSYWMWQYFSGGSPSDTPGGTGCFAFDEVHFKLDKQLKEGDKIRIQSTGASGVEYGVDFLEIENVPNPIEQPDNSVNVEDYGAIPDDGIDDLDAIRAAVRDADANNMDVYFPEGTFHLSGMWNIGCSNMKITGAGMWYTNLQFTSSEAFGGGISGGNPNAGDGTSGDGYCKNLEFCNMYINSNLRSRYGENAVYKCFMDIFADGTVIHDVWEDHFECGFWFGDYNGALDYSDDVKVVNCRIRNNLADGVNFCQGTSNAAVYNCSIRNNGDDGLAMWNNTYMNAKDEKGNIFAYNTIDFVWRAGGIAIYGGDGHKIYNNYICDMFMASGIHLNTTFPGYKFGNTTGISFDNNILVRCGTNSDSWGEDLSAIDIKQDVKNVTFNNTQIYDSPFTAIRILDNNCSGITFNNTKIFGAGLSGQDITFSCNTHSPVAIREPAGTSVKFNGLEIAGIRPDKYANNAGQANTTWPYWTDRQTPQNIAGNSTVTVYDEDTTYIVPGYPNAVNGEQGGGIVNPLDGITGYDLIVTGLAWANADGSSVLKHGDKVQFTMQIKNDSNVDIPEGVTIPVKVTIDDTTSFKYTKFKSGLKAGATAAITLTSIWSATKGGHTVEAVVDDSNKLPDELDENNNTRTKKINVADTGSSTTVKRVTGGGDLVVTDITYGQDKIATGDKLQFTATVVNAGDTAIAAGTKIGVQFQIDGKAYPSPITWCDTYYSGLQPGESVQLTANGGNGSDGAYWTAEEGTHTVTAWVDDSGLISEVDESNNKTTISLKVPFGGTQYFDDPDSPDDFTGTGGGEEQPTKPTPTTVAPTQKPTEAPTQAPTVAPTQKPTEAPTTKAPEPTTKAPEVKYELSVQGLAWENTSGSSELKEGDAVKFTALLYNNTGDDIPAGQAIGFKAVIDGSTTVKNEAYTGGLKAGETVKVTATTTWTAGYGGHTVVATATGDSQNSVTKKFNVGRKSANVTKVTGGYDLVVTDIEYDKNTVNTGDHLVFTATVMNAGDTDIPAGTVIGYQLQVDGNTSDIRWCDTYSSGLKAGASIKLTCNSGSNGINYWSATNGTHTVTAWVDDVNRLPNEVNENNNTTGITLVVPSAGLIENPDTPDDLDNIVIDPGKVTISSSVKIEGYQISTTLGGSRVVGSVEPTINNKAVKNWGFIYAVTKAGDASFDVSDDDMVVGTTSKYVTALESTPVGTAENVKFGSSDTATYFVRTTLFGANTAKEYSAQYKVRAYAELSDGTYVYSKVSSYSVYDIADTLYSNKMMNTITAHDYLYNNILKVVNPDYAQVDYNWGNTVADASEIE